MKPLATTPYLPKCVTKIIKESGRCSRFKYGVATCQGWRITQEDAHLAITDIEQNTSIFGVFDGHNGPEVAKFAAIHLPEQLLKNENYRKGFIERGLQEAFMSLDELLLTKEADNWMKRYREANYFKSDHPKSAPFKSFPMSYFIGCTAVILLVKNDIYYCTNVGDSRCLISRNGRALQLSRDHKPDLDEERARIEKAGGSVVGGRINMGIDVSRSFGDHWYKRNTKMNSKQQMMIAWPYSVVEKIDHADEFAVLICDGIWNAMDNQELIEFIHKGLSRKDPLVKICEDVIKHILPVEAMPKVGIAGKDNMTIMIIKRIGTLGSPHPNPHSRLIASTATNLPRSTSKSNNNSKSEKKSQKSKRKDQRKSSTISCASKKVGLKKSQTSNHR